MTKKFDVVREYTEAVWSNPPSSAMVTEATYLSDDFQNLDNDGNVLMDKKAYIGMVHFLFTAFKDFKWLQIDLRQVGDSVIMSGHFEGTHMGDLDLSALGASSWPPAGNAGSWAEEGNK